MIVTSILLFLELNVMLQSHDSVSIQPGKQLPQSLRIPAADGAAAQDVAIPYLLFVPQQYDATNEPMPLLLFLHGLGECGNGNLELVKTHGPPRLVEHRPNFPFVVISPQCPPPPGGMDEVPSAWKPEPLIRLVDHVASQLRIDGRRIYVTGLSMGGYGTWRLAAAYPERIAAIVPICGGGEPRAMAPSLARVPVWCFHGARDSVVALARSQEMVNAICRRGGRVRFTIYRDAEHDSWTETYNNERVYEWLLSHRGPKP